MANEAPASLSLKARLTQAAEPQSTLSANPIEKWVEGLRSTFESESAKKPLAARFRSA